jgi:hypothetical protein
MKGGWQDSKMIRHCFNRTTHQSCLNLFNSRTSLGNDAVLQFWRLYLVLQAFEGSLGGVYHGELQLQPVTPQGVSKWQLAVPMYRQSVRKNEPLKGLAGPPTHTMWAGSGHEHPPTHPA